MQKAKGKPAGLEVAQSRQIEALNEFKWLTATGSSPNLDRDEGMVLFALACLAQVRELLPILAKIEKLYGNLAAVSQLPALWLWQRMLLQNPPRCSQACVLGEIEARRTSEIGLGSKLGLILLRSH